MADFNPIAKDWSVLDFETHIYPEACRRGIPPLPFKGSYAARLIELDWQANIALYHQQNFIPTNDQPQSMTAIEALNVMFKLCQLTEGYMQTARLQILQETHEANEQMLISQHNGFAQKLKDQLKGERREFKRALAALQNLSFADAGEQEQYNATGVATPMNMNLHSPRLSCPSFFHFEYNTQTHMGHSQIISSRSIPLPAVPGNLPDDVEDDDQSSHFNVDSYEYDSSQPQDVHDAAPVGEFTSPDQITPSEVPCKSLLKRQFDDNEGMQAPAKKRVRFADLPESPQVKTLHIGSKTNGLAQSLGYKVNPFLRRPDKVSMTSAIDGDYLGDTSQQTDDFGELTETGEQVEEETSGSELFDQGSSYYEKDVVEESPEPYSHVASHVNVVETRPSPKSESESARFDDRECLTTSERPQISAGTKREQPIIIHGSDSEESLDGQVEEARDPHSEVRKNNEFLQKWKNVPCAFGQDSRPDYTEMIKCDITFKFRGVEYEGSFYRDHLGWYIRFDDDGVKGVWAREWVDMARGRHLADNWSVVRWKYLPPVPASGNASENTEEGDVPKSMALASKKSKIAGMRETAGAISNDREGSDENGDGSQGHSTEPRFDDGSGKNSNGGNGNDASDTERPSQALSTGEQDADDKVLIADSEERGIEFCNSDEIPVLEDSTSSSMSPKSDHINQGNGVQTSHQPAPKPSPTKATPAPPTPPPAPQNEKTQKRPGSMYTYTYRAEHCLFISCDDVPWKRGITELLCAEGKKLHPLTRADSCVVGFTIAFTNCVENAGYENAMKFKNMWDGKLMPGIEQVLRIQYVPPLLETLYDKHRRPYDRGGAPRRAILARDDEPWSLF